MIKFHAKTPTGGVIKSALTPFTFPSGEVSVKREDRRPLEDIEIAVIYGSADEIHKDLYTMSMWSDYLFKESPNSRQVVVIPYFPGARGDKDTPFATGIYVSHFLTAPHVDEIMIFDPHSEVVVNELKKLSGTKITVLMPEDLFAQNLHLLPQNFVGVIAPDAGAVNRAADVAAVLGVPFYTATKKRDPATGKLSSFEVENLPDEGHLLIVDDICDGGGTFLGLVGAAGERKGKMSLYVSHGIFTGKAFENLHSTFRHVFTTNSFNPLGFMGIRTYGGHIVDNSDKTFKRLDVISLMVNEISYPAYL